MFGVNIDLFELREFGCLAWVFIPPGMRRNGKLVARGVKGILIGLGHPLRSPAYLVQLGNHIIWTPICRNG